MSIETKKVTIGSSGFRLLKVQVSKASSTSTNLSFYGLAQGNHKEEPYTADSYG